MSDIYQQNTSHIDVLTKHHHHWEKIEWDAALQEWVEDFWPPMIEGEFRCRCGAGAVNLPKRGVVSFSPANASGPIVEIPYGDGKVTHNNDQ